MNIVMILTVFLFLFLFLTFTGIFIKRFFIDKRTITLGSQTVGENIYMQYQNEAKRKALEQVIYHKEEEQEENEGDDISRHLKEK